METYKGTVYPWQCDILQHMNMQYYAAKFDEAAWNFIGALGFTNKYIKEHKEALVSMEQHVKYYKELREGDLIRIETNLVEVRQKSIHYRHTMYNVETKAMTAEMDVIAVHINTENRRSINFSNDTKERLERTLR